ncbi:MAG: HypC/HybG/HupF family hydrogenase formation chaperone [Pseudomonadota bacterium]
MCLAIPGRVLSVSGDEPITRVGRVDFGGIVKEINLAFVPEAGVGDYVVVHVGCALTKIDQEEACRTLALLAEVESAAQAETAP